MKPLVTIALLGLALSAPAMADGDGERAALVRLIGEIDALEPLISEARRQADNVDRARFGYDWLRRDLEAMKSGIREHVERPRAEPGLSMPLVEDPGRR